MATGDVKENEFGKVNSIEDGSYIRMMDPQGNSVRISKEDFTKALSSFIKETLSTGLQVAGYQTSEGGLYFTTDKYIGISAANGIESVLLIAPFSAISTLENWRGCIGNIQLARGSITAGIISVSADIVIAKAYSHIEGSCNSTQDGLKVGYCRFNQQMYLAIYFPALSTFGISFSGRFSGNCVFLTKKYSDVTDWTDI